MATQELLGLVKEEVLSTTKLPLAIDFLASELRHAGGFSSAMARLRALLHDVSDVCRGRGRERAGTVRPASGAQDSRARGAVPRREPPPQGLFFYQFECLCRNRLGYDKGLEAIAGDPIFDDAWREWILIVRRQVGIVDFGDMIYVRSEQFVKDRLRKNADADAAGEAGVVRREGGPHRLGEPAEGPAVVVCRTQPAAWLSERAASRNRSTRRRRSCRRYCVGWRRWNRG